jgi:hypothetical protein
MVILSISLLAMGSVMCIAGATLENIAEVFDES